MTLYPEPAATKRPIVQVYLVHQIDPSHSRTMTTWVNKHPALKEGVDICLTKQPNIKWRVIRIYPVVHESTEFDWHRKWDNNI